MDLDGGVAAAVGWQTAAGTGADALILPLPTSGPPTGRASEVLGRLGLDPGRLAPLVDPAGLTGQPIVVPGGSRVGARWVILVPVRDGTTGALRDAAMAAARRCYGHGAVLCTLTEAGSADASTVEAVTEGLLLGLRRFHRYHRLETEAPSPSSVILVDERPGPSADDAARAIAQATTIAGAANWARDLVDTPAADATPSALAGATSERLGAAGVGVEVTDAPALRAAGYGGLVAVGSGSAHPPCLVRLSYRGSTDGGDPIVLVGKGITFDSGGLDLKPHPQMATMKQDMAGAAAIGAAVLAAAELRLAVDVVGYLALAENMPGGSALRPGDIVRHLDGTTTEVASPDAEGRLALSDVLVRATLDRPTAIVDVATLTGGGGVGPERWAILGTDDDLVEALLAAGEASGEPGWRLPVPAAYRRYLRSSIADRRNLAAATRYGFDAVAGGVYLRDFVGDVPWAHLDTSAVAMRDGITADAAWPVGATGWPARALIAWLRARDAAERPLRRSASAGRRSGRPAS